MTCHRVIILATAALWALGAGPATAAGSATVDVTASVKEVCIFSAATMAPISFGLIDPSLISADLTKDGNITYRCTNGLTPAITLPTTPLKLTDGANTIAYSLTLGTYEAGKGFSGTKVSTVVATAKILQTDAQDAKAGTGYTDTVTLTINY